MFHRFSFFFAVLLFLCLLFPFHHSDSLAEETDAIKPGDKVGIEFTCRFQNGEIAASTSTAVAEDSSLRKSAVFLPASKNDPVEVVADQSARVNKSSFPVAFEDEIAARIAGSLAGMKPGEARNIEIRSERPADVPEKEQLCKWPWSGSSPRNSG